MAAPRQQDPRPSGFRTRADPDRWPVRAYRRHALPLQALTIVEEGMPLDEISDMLAKANCGLLVVRRTIARDQRARTDPGGRDRYAGPFRSYCPHKMAMGRSIWRPFYLRRPVAVGAVYCCAACCASAGGLSAKSITHQCVGASERCSDKKAGELPGFFPSC